MFPCRKGRRPRWGHGSFGIFLILSLVACTKAKAKDPAADLDAEYRKALKQFKAIVDKEIKEYNEYHRQYVRNKAYKNPDGYYKTYRERLEPVSNIRDTLSRTAPFIAAFSFKEKVFNTPLHQSKDRAKADTNYTLSHTYEREHIYMYTGGKWELKDKARF